MGVDAVAKGLAADLERLVTPDTGSDPANLITDSANWLLEMLPEPDQILARWYFVDGLALREIAVALGLAESAVSLRADRIRKNLAVFLA